MSEAERDPLARLRALDDAIARRGASVQSRSSVRRRLQQRAMAHGLLARLRWWPVLAFAAGAITMAVLVTRGDATVHTRTPAPAEAAPSAAPATVAVEVAEPPPSAPSCAPRSSGVAQLEVDACVLADGVRVSALVRSRVDWHGDTIDVDAGEVLFDVAPRPGRPLHVGAGALDIEVVGTRFLVHHDDAGSWVFVIEGHVRARAGDAAVQDLRDGQRLQWSRAAVAPTSVRAATRAPSPRARKPDDDGLAALLAEVAGLRRAGAYREAVERLRHSDTERLDARARQLVSYEIGTLLERQLGDDAQACQHWAAHRRRFPGGRYDAIVVRSLQRLGCDVAP